MAYVTQAQTDIDKIRAQIQQTRGRITADLQHAYREVTRAESAQKLARADLDLARDQLTLDLTRYDEGQVTMAQVEASRAAEQEKWIAYYDTQHALEVARLTVLRQTGTLVAALREVATPALVERRHFAIQAHRGFHQADADGRAAALAQPQVEIEQRACVPALPASCDARAQPSGASRLRSRAPRVRSREPPARPNRI